MEFVSNRLGTGVANPTWQSRPFWWCSWLGEKPMGSKVVRGCLFGLGVVLMVLVGTSQAFAYVTPVAAPEIDGGSIAAGFAAASSAALILKARLGSRK